MYLSLSVVAMVPPPVHVTGTYHRAAERPEPPEQSQDQKQHQDEESDGQNSPIRLTTNTEYQGISVAGDHVYLHSFHWDMTACRGCVCVCVCVCVFERDFPSKS